MRSKIALDIMEIRTDLLALQTKILIAQGNYPLDSEENLDLREIYKRISESFEFAKRKGAHYGLEIKSEKVGA